MSERRTKLTDALVRVLCRLLTPIGVALPGPHDEYMRDSLLPLAAHGDGHVLTVAVALLLAILTGRSDLCIAGFYAIVHTKENVAAKVLADQISDLAPAIRSAFWTVTRSHQGRQRQGVCNQNDVRCQ